MLPKAEGCCTGLQLSAKEVVLGRPDMASRSCSAPITSLFLPSPSASPRRLGGPCRSLARSAGGDGRDAPHETPGPPLPPPGEAPSPLGLCRALRPASSFSSFSSRRPLLTKPSFPAAPVGPRAASAQSAAPPAPLLLPAATEGGLLGLAAPTLGASHMGRRLTAWLLRSLAGFLFFFPFSSFFFLLFLSPPLASPLLPPRL